MQNLICEQRFVDYFIQSAPVRGKILIVDLAVGRWVYSVEVAFSLVLIHCFLQDVAEFETARFLQQRFKSLELGRMVLFNPVDDLFKFGVHFVISDVRVS